jgi:ABC-type multidrug transport system fused ATPase/permease subunit
MLTLSFSVSWNNLLTDSHLLLMIFLTSRFSVSLNVTDDPLSALDPEVGELLFEQCILGLLKGKTRLLVTNQLQCLKHCDTVVSLGKGRVIEKGTYQDLMAAKHGEVRRLLEELKDSEPDKSSKTESRAADIIKDDPLANTVRDSDEKDTQKMDKNDAALTTKEERNVGAVKLSVYLQYFQAGGGYLRFSVVFVVFILCTAINLMTNVWVSVWSSDATYEKFSIGFYLGIYAAIALSLGVFVFLRSYMLATFGIAASKRLHENVLDSVLRAPMSFFDTTPTGRILSRFSKDMFSVDTELTEYFDFFLWGVLYMFVSLGTIAYITPLFAAAVLPILFVYFKVLNYFRDVSRETKRLDSLSRSPVYSQFSETLGGLATIRAYGQTNRFVADFLGRLDENTRAHYCNKTAERWLSVRLEIIGATISGLAAVFAARVSISGSGDINFASVAGLSLTSAIGVTGVLNFVVRSFAQLEAAMNACERVFYYTDYIPHEAPTTADALEKHAASSSPSPDDPSAFAVVASGGKAVHTSPEWPIKGSILLDNLVMRYRSGTPMVLKGLNVFIDGGERIGVVGRTGSGKSSLLLCLMRIVEPELSDDDVSLYRPPIKIDGVDVLRMGLDELRSKLGIIPQNPVLFSGTIRMNMDPFDEYTDEQIWSALDRCGMKTKVEAMPGELTALVAEYGENLSQGQRQLLCLGRALLKQCRVLLLDEATSSVDFETDREIQRTLRDSFAGSTVLTIAHRINTIMDSDKILVMKDGVASEFASPQELLSDEDSLFSEIVRHAKAESH